MDFGKLDFIQGVDWILPEDDPKNESVLKRSTHQPRVFLGSPAWGSKFFIGKIYPKNTPTDQFLYHYSRQFDCIELNTAHHQIPSDEKIKSWLDQIPSHFLFCPKIHKDISHCKTGILDPVVLKQTFHFLESIQSHLGPAFIQFNEHFSYDQKSYLFKFLESWPKEFRLSVELRHPSWFPQRKILPALGEYLQKKGIGLVITDVAGHREVLHSSLTAPWSMIRLVGNDLDESDSSRLKDWSARIQGWQDRGLSETFLFVHQPDDVWTIEFAQLAGKIFNEAGFKNFAQVQKIQERDLFNF